MLVLRLNLKFIITQYEIIELWAMILHKYHMCIIYDFILDILFFSLVTNFMCTCFLVDIYLMIVVHLETYIHERNYIFY